MKSHETTWMQRALELAERGRGYVEPNPLVGAVLVRDGKIVGEGWHEKFGEAHAEINAIAQAGEAARGATLYVTLEPCCHQGKTPPCTDAIIQAGIADVVTTVRDPFPQVAGQGAKILEQAGIPITFGLGEVAAKKQNAPYFRLVTTGRPYVHAKWAMSLDGKIATRTGDSKWISNEASRRKVHELRGRMDAIIVGIGTALADDPLLTARPPGPRTACRVVLDSQARLPLGSQLVATAKETPTLVVTTKAASGVRCAELRKQGCEILILATEQQGRPNFDELLLQLGQKRWMTNVLVEGGGEVLGALFDAKAIDECHVFIGQKLLGGQGTRSPLRGTGIATLTEALTLNDAQIEILDGDVYVHGPVTS